MSDPVLFEGQIVHFILPDGTTHRPAIVTEADLDSEQVNLQVFVQSDDNLSTPGTAASYPGYPVWYRPYVNHNEEGGAGTWHYPEGSYVSTTAKIVGFVINGVEGVIDEENKTIQVDLVELADLAALTPNIRYIGTTIVPDDEEERDFSSPIDYDVTAEDGVTTVTYTVTVTIPN